MKNFNAYLFVIYIYIYLYRICLIDILELTVKCYIWPTLVQTWVDTISSACTKGALHQRKRFWKPKAFKFFNYWVWSFPASLLMLSKCALQDRNNAKRNKFLHGCRHTSKIRTPAAQAAIMETTWCGVRLVQFLHLTELMAKKKKKKGIKKITYYI